MATDRLELPLTIESALEDTATALELTATLVGGSLTIREKHLQAAFRRALERRLNTAVQTSKKMCLPNWLGESGPVDVVVPGEEGVEYLHYALRGRALFELKWAYTNKVAEVIWDAFKLVQATAVCGVEGAYLVVGAPERYWLKPVAGAELLADRDHDPLEIIERYPAAFADLVDNSAGLPLRLPSAIRTKVIARSVIPFQETSWELRVAAVEPARQTWVSLVDRWPPGSATYADSIAAKVAASQPFVPPPDPPHYEDPEDAPSRWWRFAWYPGDLEFLDGEVPNGAKPGSWTPGSADELLEALGAVDEPSPVQRKQLFGFVQSGHPLAPGVEFELKKRGLLIYRPTKQRDVEQARLLVSELVASTFAKGELVAAVMEMTGFEEGEAREIISTVLATE